MGNRIFHCLLFHEHGKQKHHTAISPVKEAIYYSYTHTWTKLHSEVSEVMHELNLWCLCMARLSEVNSTSIHDLTGMISTSMHDLPW